ncbi:hypothetical protein TNCV_2082961 [Trichonephila clavipes]|nr:hypothetical protein TNCV_2082961 [Trichonephila clavipes]
MFRLGNTRPLPGHSSIGSISTRKNLHPGVTPPTTKSNKEAVCRSSGKIRHGAYLNSVSSGAPKRGTTSRLKGEGSLLPPVYSEAWAKGIPRTPFSSL